ncbi:MAG: sensor histidine kinase [Lachnospiraceae bacterium]|nr:sensor histidine kinase [Lachnospiraceae bacterium]
MKDFFRTIAGKSLLFITVICCGIIILASAIGIYGLVEGDFYTRSEEMVSDDLIEQMMTSYGDDIIWANESDTTDDLHARLQTSNLIYELRDENGALLDTNADGGETFTHSLSFGIMRMSNGQISDIFYHRTALEDENVTYYTINTTLREGLPYQDRFAFASKWIHVGYALRYAVCVIAAFALLLGVSALIALMTVSGRRPGRDDLVPGPLHPIPTDLMAAAMLLLLVGIFYFGDAFDYHGTFFLVVFVAGCGLIYANLALGFLMSLAVRTKDRSLFKNTIIWKVIKLCWRIFLWFLRGIKRIFLRLWKLIAGIPLIWKTALITGVICLFEFIVIMFTQYEIDNLLGIWFVSRLILVPAIFYLALLLRKLQKGGEALATGDLSYQIPLKGMIGDFKQHAINLNDASFGLTNAVEERLKSERMKTELITNVSHDIKTPLTSIINYASLISNEPTENERITEYSEVLVRQSERLKRLIEDLVEASKASTGNLDVLLAPCDPSIFLTQAAGEYEEKLASAHLSLITKQPEQEVHILADSRRMWRIFDNLMNNICKYAQEGTRVYLTLEVIDNNAVISFKNTSRDALDISEEELMERFVRGDASRNTEGNGLGLSIAKSLAELQNGTLNLQIDGDLFKAILTFPIIA